MFALYQPDGGIFGIGETAEAARADAAEWLEGGMDEALRAELFHAGQAERSDRLYIRECTRELAAAVLEDSGTVVYDVNQEGLLDLIEIIE